MLKTLTAALLTAAWIAYVAASVYALWQVLTNDPALFPKHYTLEVGSAWLAGRDSALAGHRMGSGQILALIAARRVRDLDHPPIAVLHHHPTRMAVPIAPETAIVSSLRREFACAANATAITVRLFKELP